MLPSGEVTFLFTDIEQSTRLGQRLGAAFIELMTAHDRLLRAAIEGNDGVVVKSTGDGFFAVFTDAGAALAAATDAMRSVHRHAWPGGVELRVRMGLHTAEATPTGADYVSLAVHQAARIADAGHGCQILLSDATVDALGAPPPSTDLVPLGRFRLKDFDDPVALVRVLRPDLPNRDAAPRVVPMAGHNMPLRRTSFVGRDEDLRVLEKLLADNALVTLTGPGGIGKSRMAARAAAELVADYPDGVWLVELAPVGPERVLTTVAGALGLPPSAEGVTSATIAHHLEHRRLLLLLDNCEHVLDAAAELVDAILSRCPDVTVLATSRQHLDVAGEQRFPLGPLPSPVPGASPGEVLETAAGRLFVERATASRPQFALTAATAPAVTRICRRLDGLPLALELAAARIRHLDAETLADHIEQRLDLLTTAERATPARHRTLGALLDWSYDLLDDQQRRLFRRLAVFVGGTTLDAVSEVCAHEHLDGLQVIDVLAELVDRSLVIVSEQPSSGVRYALLETAREYAAARLAGSDEEHVVREAHRRYYLDLVRRIGPRVYQTADAVHTLEADRENIRTALGNAVHTDPRAAVDACVDLASFWLLRAYLQEAQQALDEVQQTVAPDDELGVARLDLARGRLLSTYDTGDTGPVAVERLARAITVFDRHDEPVLAATAAAAHARALAEFGRFGDAESAARDAYQRGLATQDAPSIAYAGLTIGFVAVLHDDHQEAERVLREARSLSLDQRRLTASIDDLRGWCAQLRNDLSAARALHASALQVMDEFRDNRNRAVITMHLAEVAWRAGHTDEVVDRGLSSARIGLRAYFPSGAANAMLFVALACVGADPETAARILGCVDRMTEGPDLDLSDDEAQWRGQCEVAARAALGTAYDTMHAAGRDLTIEELVSSVSAHLRPEPSPLP